MNLLPLVFAGLQTMSALLPTKEKDVLTRFNEKFQDAYSAYSAGDRVEALRIVRLAEDINPGTAIMANFRGGILLDEGKYDDAISWLQDALKRDPTFMPARINLIDIDFRLGKYAKSRTAFQVLLAETPGDEFLQYRTFLSALREKDDVLAKSMLGTIKFPGDTPAYYFAHGAWAFEHGDRTEAMGWIDPGLSIFGYDRCRQFAEPLEVLGWLTPGHQAPTSPQANPPIQH